MSFQVYQIYKNILNFIYNYIFSIYSDGLHLTAEGNAVVYQEVERVLREAWLPASEMPNDFPHHSLIDWKHPEKTFQQQCIWFLHGLLVELILKPLHSLEGPSWVSPILFQIGSPGDSTIQTYCVFPCIGFISYGTITNPRDFLRDFNENGASTWWYLVFTVCEICPISLGSAPNIL